MLLGGNTDRLLWGMSLPSDTVVHDIKGVMHLIGTQDLSYVKGGFYGMTEGCRTR